MLSIDIRLKLSAYSTVFKNNHISISKLIIIIFFHINIITPSALHQLSKQKSKHFKSDQRMKMIIVLYFFVK